MTPLLIYMVKTSIYLAGFYLVYTAFLARDTMYSRNRIFILCSLILSFILPAFTVRTNETGVVAYFGRTLSEILITGNGSYTGAGLKSGTTTGVIIILLRIYIIGMVVFAVKLVSDLFRLIFLIRNHKDKNGILVRFDGLDTAGFSAMGHVFINKSVSAEEADEIFRHEMNHLKNNHFLDIILMEIVKIPQWFNPVVHMLNRSLRAVHEYQADEGYLKTGVPVVRYQNLLLNHILKSKLFIASNSFSNPTLIKKRMIMMTKKRSNGLANLKLLMVIPVAVITLLIFSACGSSTNTKGNTNEVAPQPPPPPPISETPIYAQVDQLPVFHGGDDSLRNYVMKNIIYPETAKKNKITGKVVVRFCVTDKGKIEKAYIIQGVDSSLDNEAIRVINSMPPWTPGKKDGKEVNVWFALPITFSLN